MKPERLKQRGSRCPQVTYERPSAEEGPERRVDLNRGLRGGLRYASVAGESDATVVSATGDAATGSGSVAATCCCSSGACSIGACSVAAGACSVGACSVE